MWKLQLPNFKQELIFKTNSGKIMDLAVSGTDYASVSIGEDGALRVWDYIAKKEIINRSFKGKGTCLEWLPQNNTNRGRIIFAGYNTGIMRILLIKQNEITLIKALKVQKTSLTHIKVSPNKQVN